jgi:PPM family protein phosphatase
MSRDIMQAQTSDPRAITSLDLDVASESRIGPVRLDNQDACAVVVKENEPTSILWLIADGMGGYEYGDIASKMAVDILTKMYLSSIREMGELYRTGVETANLAVMQKALELRSGPIGTTLTAACLQGSHLIIAHVGDSRVYLIRGGKINCLTRDHTVVGELTRMRVLDSEAARTHSQRSILTRAIGLSPVINPDISRVEIQQGDRILLCTDGLWSAVADNEILLASGCCTSAGNWVTVLMDLACERITDDNLTAIGIHVNQLAERPSARLLPGWTWLRAFTR